MLRVLVAAIACAACLSAVELEDHVRKSAPVGSATRMTLNAEVGAIRVQSASGKNVDVDVYFKGSPPSKAEFDRMRRDFTLDVVEEGSDIRVVGAFHKGWQPMLAQLPSLFGGHAMCRNWECLEYSYWLREVEFRVTVPENLNADVETSGGPISVSGINGQVNAHTSGGGITLKGGKGNAVVRTSGGPIRITDVAGDIDASTSGGPISIERNMGRVRARTSGGGIEIREATGAVNASTSGGGVSASLIGQPKEECRLSTSGGSIDVSLSKDIHADLDASSSGGGVWTDFPVPLSDDRHPRELHARLNGGGPLLYLHTSGGGITVRRAD
jgi:hypothetical protein